MERWRGRENRSYFEYLITRNVSAEILLTFYAFSRWRYSSDALRCAHQRTVRRTHCVYDTFSRLLVIVMPQSPSAPPTTVTEPSTPPHTYSILYPSLCRPTVLYRAGPTGNELSSFVERTRRWRRRRRRPRRRRRRRRRREKHTRARALPRPLDHPLDRSPCCIRFFSPFKQTYTRQ